MSKILSYNNKTTGEGWIPLTNQYCADEINMISDPNGGLSAVPRTAIPSPFAQMDLVKNAFGFTDEDIKRMEGYAAEAAFLDAAIV